MTYPLGKRAMSSLSQLVITAVESLIIVFMLCLIVTMQQSIMLYILNNLALFSV